MYIPFNSKFYTFLKTIRSFFMILSVECEQDLSLTGGVSKRGAKCA